MPNAYWLSCVCRCLLVTLDGMSSAWSTTSPATFVRSSRVSAWWCTWECSTFCGGPSAWSTFWRWSGKNRWRVPGCFVHCLVCCFHGYMLLILARRLHSFSLFVCYFVPVRGVSTAISMSLRPSAHNRMKFSVHVTCGHGLVHRSAMHYVLLVLWMTSCVHIMSRIQIQAWSLLSSQLLTVTRQVAQLNCASRAVVPRKNTIILKNYPSRRHRSTPSVDRPFYFWRGPIMKWNKIILKNFKMF